MEQGHRDGNDRDDGSRHAREAVGGAFFLFDEFLGLAQCLVGNRALRRQTRVRQRRLR